MGHTRLTFAGRCAAAILACGPGAAISHLTAAVLWGMLSFHSGPIELTSSKRGGKKRRSGIKIHRSPLGEASVSRKEGVPVTSPLRTLEDLKRTRRDLHQPALRKALDLNLITEADLGPDPDLTRSKLEKMLMGFVRRRRLPKPQVNARVEGYEVDFLWPDARVIVEADSYRHHGDRLAFERDRLRDNRLNELGYRVLRVTWRMLEDEPGAVRSSLCALLMP